MSFRNQLTFSQKLTVIHSFYYKIQYWEVSKYCKNSSQGELLHLRGKGLCTQLRNIFSLISRGYSPKKLPIVNNCIKILSNGQNSILSRLSDCPHFRPCPHYQNHSSKKLSPFHQALGLSRFIEKMGTNFLRVILISGNQM